MAGRVHHIFNFSIHVCKQLKIVAFASRFPIMKKFRDKIFIRM